MTDQSDWFPQADPRLSMAWVAALFGGPDKVRADIDWLVAERNDADRERIRGLF
jgi:hypothetical protein